MLFRSKNAVTKAYAQTMQDYDRYINIHFYKVAAHTGVEFNELADELAKRALNN